MEFRAVVWAAEMVAVGDADANIAKLSVLPGIFQRYTVLLSPIGGEAAGAGGGENGLAKAFEKDGNFGQPLLTGIHFA